MSGYATPEEAVRAGDSVPRQYMRIVAVEYSPDNTYAVVFIEYNEPRTVGAPVALGERVEFGPDHVIDALPPENWNAETGEYEQ